MIFFTFFASKESKKKLKLFKIAIRLYDTSDGWSIHNSRIF